MIILLFYVLTPIISAADGANDCWWTGCQPVTWGVRGCQQYGRDENGRRDCDGGHEFNCCLPSDSKPAKTTTTTTTKSPPKEDSSCWWTGCQPTTWGVRGCQQYDRDEMGKRDCDGGHEFNCCPKKPATTKPENSCWWTGCQSNSWAVRGCQQYQKVEVETRKCNDGLEYHCCDEKIPPKVPAGAKEVCWWSTCTVANSSTFTCPSVLSLKGSEDCRDGSKMFECCGIDNTENEKKPNVNMLTGESYEDFVKYLFLKNEDYSLKPDNIRCDMLDPGKKNLIKVKDEGIRICDLCPYFPQKHLSNVFLDRVPVITQRNIHFADCFALCYEEKTCMAISYDHSSSTCYTFDSTAGGYEEHSGWTTVLMTQPSGVVQDWTYTRHTRLLGHLKYTSSQPSFLHCLDDCEHKTDCNFLSYYTTTKNCSLFTQQDDIFYVDLIYGHLSAIRVSYSANTQSVDGRFVLEGEELKVLKTEGIKDKCSSFRNGTHGAIYNQACLVSGSTLIGCDQSTGCKMCYYPENVEDREKLSVCPDSEIERLTNIKNSILSKMKTCFTDKSCIGVGYNSKTEEVSSMKLEDYSRGSYTSYYILKIPPNDSRSYLGRYDILIKSDIKSISTNMNDYQELKNKNYAECLDSFSRNNIFTVMSYSHEKRLCKLGTERTGFAGSNSDSFVVFKRPSFLSPILNYLRIPGFKISGNKPRATTEHCSQKCEELCSSQCSKEHGDWCFYIDIKLKPNGAKCQFYDDEGDFKIDASEENMVFSRVSALDFSLESFNKLSDFQSSDIYNCFAEPTTQTQTSLTVFKGETTQVQKFRGRRGIFDFFKKIGKAFVDGVKAVGRAVVNTAKGVVDTVKNVVKGDLKAAAKSFTKIPVVELAKNTVELGGAVVTGDWDKAKKKGKEILESDGFELVTTVALPGVGKIATTAAKVGVKAITQAGKKGASAVAKVGKNKVDDVAKDSRKVKNNKNDDGSKNKKKDEKIEKERGEKCDEKKRPKRASNTPSPPPSPKPGNCQPKKNPGKCSRPKRVTYVIGKTLDECDNAKAGDICSYECKPGYHEKKTTAICSKEVWEPKPKCEQEVCENKDKSLIVVETPQAEAFGVAALGDYITAYVVLYNKKRQLPIWSVALHQSSSFESKNYNAAKTVKRLKGFTKFNCKELKAHQAHNNDYKGSGYHKGHLTPANVARWSEKSKRVSNLYINAAPQNGYTNSGPWNLLEAHVYCFSKRYRTVVATGICDDNIPGEKAGSIPVPTCYWKMACYKDENEKYQVVGFYASNKKVNNEADEIARTEQIFTPLSQEELKAKIKGDFNGVWSRPAFHLNTGRPVPVGNGVWLPINTVECEFATLLSKDERGGWKAAFDKSKHHLKRGKNAKEDDDTDDDDESDSDDDDRRRRKRQANKGLDRGCHGSEMKNALDDNGFFVPYSDAPDLSDSEDDDDDHENDEGDGSVKVSVQSCGKRIVGYYTSWGEKTIAGLELQRLTHIIYAFLEMHADGSISVGSADRKNSEDIDKETKKAKRRLENLMESAKRYPHLKVLFAVGGWENSQYFSSVAASPGMRVKFIASVIQMIEQYGFDGVDIDWEYPVTGGADEGVPADKQNYVQLMKELRTALDGLADKAGRKEKFLISFAGAAGQWTLDPGYDMPGMFKYIDFVNIMTYDYFGAWASKWGAYTGPPSPLYFGMPPGFSGKTNTDWTIKYYTCKTKQPHKINMGVPFYGRYWKNVGDSVDGKDEMWRKASSVNGKFEGGYVPWYKVKKEYLNNGAFQKKFHEKAKAPYAWNPSEKIFLGYENKESIEHKVKYAVEKNVGGLMIWALELDDNDLTLLDAVSKAPLCQNSNPSDVNHKCSPIDDKRWWTPEDGEDKAGLCGRSAPLYKGFYPVCDPDDPGYSCCGVAGYCGFGPKYCDCPTCKNYREDPKTILKEPIKPSIPITWYLLNDPDGKRGRCGRKIPKIGSVYPTCNPDDENSFCCSNGGYCGNTDAHCKCDGCIDFKKNPKYQFGPKKWWTLEDGEKLGGQCGPKAPKVDGIYEAECEGTSNFHCCSPNGWCGSGPDFCKCKGCKDFKT